MSARRTGNLLGALACAVVERVDGELRSHPNQNSTWLGALNLIACFDGCSNQQLAAALGLSHPATVRLVDKLEAAGLVEGHPGHDRRAVALHLTPAGHRHLGETLTRRADLLEQIVAGLNPGQRTALDTATSTLLHTLTDSPLTGAHLCRFCDERSCPQDHCPVHQRAVELARTRR